MMLDSDRGFYIVQLKNEEPISVNANDKRLADKCIKVNHLNLKFGKAKSFIKRKKNYDKTFGEENVIFTPIIAIEAIDTIETEILKELDSCRVRGRTGRKNEWLEEITYESLFELVVNYLTSKNYNFQLIKQEYA